MQTLSLCVLAVLVAAISAHRPGGAGPERPANCPPMWFGNGDYCYQFVKARETWQAASEYCARFSSCATGAGASLVKIRNAQDEIRLDGFLTPKGDPTAPNVWLGLGDPIGSGTIAWPDGTTPQSTGYQNFGQGGRNGNCVLKDSRTGQWVYAQCTQRNAFVCQLERVHVEQTPTRPGQGVPTNPGQGRPPNRPV